jgi:hypothetical protein
MVAINYLKISEEYFENCEFVIIHFKRVEEKFDSGIFDRTFDFAGSLESIKH